MAYLVIDLEMTGPDPEFHDFIQIGAVLANKYWQEIARYSTLVYPDNDEALSVYAENVHGITIHDLYDAPTTYEVLEDLVDWVKQSLNARSAQAVRSIIIAGQSVYNDISFLRAKYFKHKIGWPFAYRLLDLTNYSYIVFKVLKNNGIKNVPSRYSLDAIAKFFGIERQTDKHDALEDALITLKCFENFQQIIDQMQLPPEFLESFAQ